MATIERVLYWKLRYAIENRNDKHRADLFNMLGVDYYSSPDEVVIQIQKEDDPWDIPF